jgi:DNA ligase D-like protein (predicted 3'-phosphoesterase)
MARRKLQEYERKRHFDATTEPRGSNRGGRKRAARKRHPIFVIQLHDASTEHFDFRIEADGVLKSWAVPKGPSTNPREKRLAVPTEDHPLDYADFEGVIPKGEYGGCTVLVWDTGPYRNLTKHDGKEVPVGKAVDRGHVVVALEGEKLHGAFALTRTRRGSKESWILVKERDDDADARRKPATTQRRSVLSGRTLARIRAEERKPADGGKDRAK